MGRVCVSLLKTAVYLHYAYLFLKTIVYVSAIMIMASHLSFSNPLNNIENK